MTTRFLTPASLEPTEAIEYYETQRAGLGYEFLSEVETAVEKISDFPEAWALVSNRTRRILPKRFPFGLLYQIRNQEIVVAAVMDLRRDPAKWQDLLQ